MRLFLVLSFVLFGLSSFAQDSWRAPELAKEINNPYADNKIAAHKGQVLYSKLCWTCHGKNGKGMMVPYKHSLNEEKRWQLINYIRTLSVN